MTNREFILAELQRSVLALTDAFEGLYGHKTQQIPIRMFCQSCLTQHGGKCPDEEDEANVENCEKAAAAWLDAEVQRR